MIEVRFGTSTHGLKVSWVKRVVSATLKFEKKTGRTVSVFLTNDKQIRKINKLYLDHDYATDVISFWFEQDRLIKRESKHLGDLVVSVETAKCVAKEMGISFKQELARYLIHGTLHLLGYNDKKAEDRKRMHQRQEWIVKRLCTSAEHSFRV